MANPKGTKINEKVTKKEMMVMMKEKRQKDFDKKSAENKKKVLQGGTTSKPAPSTGGKKKIFIGVGSTTSNQKMPDVKFSKGIADKAVTFAKPKPKATPKATPKPVPGEMKKLYSKVTPKPKYTQLPRKTK